MLFLAILVLALGWAGWLWAWGRDRVLSNGGFGAPLLAGTPGDRWGIPRTAAMARRRRRDVLTALLVAAFVSLLGSQSWSALWILHFAIDVALVAYAFAVARVERAMPMHGRMSTEGGMTMARPAPISPLLSSPRFALQPIRDDGY